MMSTAATRVRILPLPVFLWLPVFIPRTGTPPVLACSVLTSLVLLLVLSRWLLLVGLLALLLSLIVSWPLLLPSVPSGTTPRRVTSTARVVARARTGETPLSKWSTSACVPIMTCAEPSITCLLLASNSRYVFRNRSSITLRVRFGAYCRIVFVPQTHTSGIAVGGGWLPDPMLGSLHRASLG